MKLVQLCCLGTLIVTVAGCGSGDDERSAKRPKVYPASGVATFNGEPLEGATVQYISLDLNLAADGITDAAGKYALTTYKPNDGAPEATYKVVVTKRIYEEKKTKDDSPDEPSVAKPPKDLLPKKYANATTTDIEASITSGGPNQATLELKGE